ncbi:Flp pilus assembly protein CpaB [Pseudomonas sp. FW306-02-F02-AA]|uniref:Flp pilus assembly protein CpaB n=1 Tax=Pseudomonas fluorescens TaxID=294 RepID=A0A0N9WDW4_PSEFL|nr:MULTISPECIES: Flp pilus assembly protein CpaB [Pseudomonas]ALH99799.1 Flp pilus assembly protein CpaB [Pseudomonas fluorescens]PMZ02955.1 Flp pilus assembly protein CpaB [Pseudomonas sp. FW306-02-F02-AB]PMZ08561.1 Flp pilus assembly protein CpaB [Pseudomonas sp. FW306-02-H06C]PMZ12448.1 Flp pilus assembly protein CpaB [Pseudomonas sp. FW306-02-F02-AA]PMZ20651.1 Flp pilus assembly protein CpaB [Pseudomonas sp. FW306-02-F08-AA]
MSSRTATLIGISLVMGLGAAWMANSWLSARLNASPDDHLRSVVVATVEIPFGQMVEAQQVTTVRMPMDTIPDDAFDSSDKAVGKIATFDILRGDIVRGARLSEHLGGSTLASLIAPDKRAISVRVDDVVGVGGFLLPGNRVDVLATKQTNGSNNNAVSRTILENLRVLAVDQTAGTDKTQPVVVRAVTLEMTTTEAEALVTAQTEGKLQLALRNPLNLTKKPTPAPVAPAAPVTQTIAMATETAPRRVVHRSSGNGGAVTVIRGIESHVVNVR